MKKFCFAAVAIYCILIISCASTFNGEPYYDDNIGDFAETSLSNGIPVVFKKNSNSKICAFRMLFDGGVALYPENKSGLDAVTFDLMLHGSKKYPYSKMQQMGYQKTFSVSSSSGKDYSVASFNCIQRDFDEVLDLFADSIMNPLLQESDFKQIMTDNASAIQRRLSDPSSVLGLEISKAIYSGHPYKTSAAVNEKSLNSISLADVKKNHEVLLDSSRIKFVVVGNIDKTERERIILLLESYFGSIAHGGYSKPDVPVVSAAKGANYGSCEQAGETGYVAGIFNIPNRDDDEYFAFALASMYLDDILFSEVREKNSAVYSIGTGVVGGKNLLGVLSVYKATEQENLKNMIQNAIKQFPSDKEVERKLSEYKNKYITSIFESSQNASGIAANIITSLEYYGAATQYLHRSARVQAVQWQNVVSAYKKYLQPIATEDCACWVVVSGSDSAKKFKFD